MLNKLNMPLKRSFDILVAVFGIAIFRIIPIFIVFPIVIINDSKGPAFFIQTRVWKNTIPFKMYKFRTMISGQFDSDGNEIMSEDRITIVEKFLRKTTLDESPQFFNIVNGTMSLVGSRRMLDYQAEHCVGEEICRFGFRLGITDLVQDKGHNDIGCEERIRYDIEYVMIFYVFLNMKIILGTIVLIFKKEGANVKPDYVVVDRFSKHYLPSNLTNIK